MVDIAVGQAIVAAVARPIYEPLRTFNTGDVTDDLYTRTNAPIDAATSSATLSNTASQSQPTGFVVSKATFDVGRRGSIEASILMSTTQGLDADGSVFFGFRDAALSPSVDDTATFAGVWFGLLNEQTFFRGNNVNSAAISYDPVGGSISYVFHTYRLEWEISETDPTTMTWRLFKNGAQVVTGSAPAPTYDTARVVVRGGGWRLRAQVRQSPTVLAISGLAPILVKTASTTATANPAPSNQQFIPVGQASVTATAGKVIEKDRATLVGTSNGGVGSGATTIALPAGAEAGDIAILSFGGVYSNSWIATNGNWRALGTGSGGNHHGAYYWKRITQEEVNAGGWTANAQNGRTSNYVVAVYRGASDLVRAYGAVALQTGSGEPVTTGFTAPRSGELLILAGHTGSASDGTYPAGWTRLASNGGWDHTQIARRNTRVAAAEVLGNVQYTNPGSQGASAVQVLVADNNPADDQSKLAAAVVASVEQIWSSTVTVTFSLDRQIGDLEVIMTSAWNGVTGPPGGDWVLLSSQQTAQPLIAVYTRRVDSTNIAQTSVTITDSSGVTTARCHYLVLRNVGDPTAVTGASSSGAQTWAADDLLIGWYTSLNDATLSAITATTPGGSDWPIGSRSWMTLRSFAAVLDAATAAFAAATQVINLTSNGEAFTALRIPLVEPPPVGEGVAVDWWDGSDTLTAEAVGWWDGSVIQPLEVDGWWDGSAIQSLTAPVAGGDLDGGAPGTTVWSRTIDGGTPSTVTWDNTIDGGTP